MIKRTLEYLMEELAFSLELDAGTDIHLENLKKLQDENVQGMVISLLNVEAEGTLKNSPHYVRKNNQLLYREPPVYLNLNTLIAFKFDNYGTSLQRLEQTVQYFQNRRWFSKENERTENPMPTGVHKLVLDLQQLNFEHLNHIWSISGGTYFLTLLYKVRLLKIQPEDEVEGPEIDTIQLNSGIL